MSSDVTLSSALRSNLKSLQNTQSSIDKVQNALSTGLKVSSALDNPQNYFAARSLNNRAGDLTKLLDGIGQSISTIKQADSSISSLTKLVEQADSIIDSAQTAAADAGVAKVTGSVDLKGRTNLISSGITNNDTLVIKVNNPQDSTVQYSLTVNISSGDSIDQLLTKINAKGTPTSGTPAGSYDSAGNGIVNASLTSDGFLQIKAANGGNLQVDFKTAADTDAANLALSSALGFGQTARLVNQTGSAADQAVQITAVAGSKLTSGVFYDANVAGKFADASDVLTTVNDTATGTTKRFTSSTSAATDKLAITINDGTAVNIDIVSGVTTIQGLVDSINGDATLKNFVKAGYDANTGQLSIEKISANTKTVEIGTNNAGVAGAMKADFDFGLSGALTSSTSTIEQSEVFTFAGASGELSQLSNDYNKVRDQIDKLVKDAGYRGNNLLAGEDVTTFFNEDRTNSLVTSGADLTTTGLGISIADFSSDSTIGAARAQVRDALDTVRSYSSSLANDLSVIQAREDFTKDTVNNLKEGADKLTLADQNEEGAKLLSLQTRQQLGVTALSLASQAQQSVLQLF